MEKLDIFDVKVVNGVDFRYGVAKNVNLCVDALNVLYGELKDWDFDVQDEFAYQEKRKEIFEKCLCFKSLIDAFYDMQVLTHRVHKRMICDLEKLIDECCLRNGG